MISDDTYADNIMSNYDYRQIESLESHECENGTHQNYCYPTKIQNTQLQYLFSNSAKLKDWFIHIIEFTKATDTFYTIDNIYKNDDLSTIQKTSMIINECQFLLGLATTVNIALFSSMPLLPESIIIGVITTYSINNIFSFFDYNDYIKNKSYKL